MSRNPSLIRSLALAVAVLMVPTTAVVAEEAVPADIQEHPACIHCGMNRTKWSHTRHLVEYLDGHVEPTCSIRCVALSLDMNWGRTPVEISGAAVGTGSEIEPLLPVDKLHYVLQADQRGTMARRSKKAYATAAEARKTAGKTGKLMNFEEALTAAYEDVVFMVMGKRKQASEKKRRVQK